MTAPKRSEPGAMGGQVLDSPGHAAQPADAVKRPAEPTGMFGSVLCGADRSVDSRAAHRHAVLFASPGGAVKIVPAPRLTRHGHRALHDACEGHDLLALGAGAGASAVVQDAPIPVLIGRWNPVATEVTDKILVPVDGSPESTRAVEFAGRAAAAHGGTVTIVVAPPRDPALQRAIAASRRILLQTTGAPPALVDQQLPRERAIPAAAVAISASLVVLGTGDSKDARWLTAQIVGRIGASVLVIPPSRLPRRRRFASDMPDPVTPEARPVGTGAGPSTKLEDQGHGERGPTPLPRQRTTDTPAPMLRRRHRRTAQRTMPPRTRASSSRQLIAVHAVLSPAPAS